MKGIVFTEFLEMVEKEYGLEMVDDIVVNASLASKGAYTAVGTYEFSEMLELLQNLSLKTKITIDDLLFAYALHFFNLLLNNYPSFFSKYTDPIELLASIESHIHVEVLKIYPDAELPSFEVIEKKQNTLIMIYKSSRSMHHFGLGLMYKTFDYFNSKATILLEKIKQNGTEVKFIITKN
ncbi:heme NO-binding domain-containing protein [Siansivirga zeaxanthinifaciens]|uniref:Heme transporter CcmB n=1 Tax=Siansivirga zeaxanthinifaciens CC-SAMT-1 TaxID=1454006 RepID=A0A0C5WCR3_9FLAO|nr:heme NO-binding domain-containing protein [Siansivirga zeaxanthinifaciens]AJR04082.1 heme transporter CcmB [Siansivirga zeaxanthinifaciens CC-SAMT-1]